MFKNLQRKKFAHSTQINHRCRFTRQFFSPEGNICCTGSIRTEFSLDETLLQLVVITYILAISIFRSSQHHQYVLYILKEDGLCPQIWRHLVQMTVNKFTRRLESDRHLKALSESAISNSNGSLPQQTKKP